MEETLKYMDVFLREFMIVHVSEYSDRYFIHGGEIGYFVSKDMWHSIVIEIPSETYRGITDGFPGMYVVNRGILESLAEHGSEKDKESRFLAYLKIASPYTVLEDIQNKELTTEELDIIFMLLHSSNKLPVEVTNVLLQYMFIFQKINRLSAGYTLRLADEWASKKITTAKEAMGYAKRCHMQRKDLRISSEPPKDRIESLQED